MADLTPEEIQKIADAVAEKITPYLPKAPAPQPYVPYWVDPRYYYPPYRTWWTVNSGGNQA